MSASPPILESPLPGAPADAGLDVEERFSRFEAFADRYGTPCYVYDADQIDARVKSLLGVLPTEVGSKLYFSFKSNPNPAVAARMREGGCRADLTSPGEIEAARMAGFDFSEALYGGPGKTEAEWSAAIAAGIRHFSVESDHDLATLGRAAEERGQAVNALIRINPEQAPQAKLAMSGVASQFGFEEEELRERGPEWLSGLGEHVRVVGVHIYWGTQIGDAEALLSCFDLAIRVAEEMSDRLDFPLEIMNLGGGFPWPYAKAGEGPDLGPLREGLSRRIGEAGAAREANWWFESGRHLAASSGTLVTRVMDRKRSKDEKEYLILDTGIHHLGGMAGLGRIPRFSIDLEVPLARRGSEEIVVDVVGQLCTPLDCIGRRIRLPEVEPGDLVAVPNVGAYGPTASVIGFLSRPAPAEILHRGNEVLAVHRLRGGHEAL